MKTPNMNYKAHEDLRKEIAAKLKVTPRNDYFDWLGHEHPAYLVPEENYWRVVFEGKLRRFKNHNKAVRYALSRTDVVWTITGRKFFKTKLKIAKENDAEFWCDICNEDIGEESHYHCPICLEICGMMGHKECHESLIRIKWYCGLNKSTSLFSQNDNECGCEFETLTHKDDWDSGVATATCPNCGGELNQSDDLPDIASR